MALLSICHNARQTQGVLPLMELFLLQLLVESSFFLVSNFCPEAFIGEVVLEVVLLYLNPWAS